MKLNELRDNPGASPKRTRVGRVRAPAKVKWVVVVSKVRNPVGCGNQRYEGGQMPLYQRLPKRGFNKPNRKEYAVVNLGLIQKFNRRRQAGRSNHHRRQPGGVRSGSPQAGRHPRSRQG